MDLAFAEAEAAGLLGEVPIGAVVVSASGEVLAHAGNRTLQLRDPTAHAELLAIREACARLGSERLIDCDLYVTLEPCAMCAAAISFAGFAGSISAHRPKGAPSSMARASSPATCHHAPEVYGGIGEARAAELLKRFFAARRYKSCFIASPRTREACQRAMRSSRPKAGSASKRGPRGTDRPRPLRKLGSLSAPRLCGDIEAKSTAYPCLAPRMALRS